VDSNEAVVNDSPVDCPELRKSRSTASDLILHVFVGQGLSLAEKSL